MLQKLLFFSVLIFASYGHAQEPTRDPEVILYYKEGCSHCHQILNYLEEEGITVPLRELGENPSYRPKIKSLLGRVRVPCLVVNGQAITGVDRIKHWFSRNSVSVP